jgi:hypothetical protein
MMEQYARVFELLRAQLANLPETARPQAEELLRLQKPVEERLQSFVELGSDGARLRFTETITSDRSFVQTAISPSLISRGSRHGPSPSAEPNAHLCRM